MFGKEEANIEKIAFLEANEEIVKRTEQLLAEQILEGDVIVRTVSIEKIEKEAWKLIRAGVKVIVARGGIYQYVSAMDAGIPIVHLVIGASDILIALQNAAESFVRAKLILHDSIPFEPGDYKGLVSIEVTRYYYHTVEDLKRIVERLHQEPGSVVVGSGAVKELSTVATMDFINIFIQNTTLVAAYIQAKRLLKQIQQEIRKNNLLSSILYHINDGVMIIDTDGQLCHVNRKSEELLGVSGADMIGRHIGSLIEAYPLKSYERLKNGETKDIIVKAGKRTVSLSTSLFLLDETQEQLIVTIQDVTEIQKTEHNVRRMLSQKGLVAAATFKQILTWDEKFRDVIHQAERISEFEGTVLIYGESGTGKELFAQSIHNQSHRRNGPFVAVNCAALSESLLESELFGYEAGAFTGARKEGKIGLFELSHKGTIFLDEINSMSLNLQAKMLRVIEQKEVMRVGSDYIIPLDVRIVAASNGDLEAKVREGGFRRDLYFRLNTFELAIPPLNKRKGDIPYLFKHFLSEYGGNNQDTSELPEEFVKLLMAHEWSGNVRELRSIALRYHAFGGDNGRGEILRESLEAEAEVMADKLRIDIKELNKAVEDSIIQLLMKKKLSKVEIAKILGISKQALFKKLQK